MQFGDPSDWEREHKNVLIFDFMDERGICKEKFEVSPEISNFTLGQISGFYSALYHWGSKYYSIFWESIPWIYTCKTLSAEEKQNLTQNIPAEPIKKLMEALKDFAFANLNNCASSNIQAKLWKPIGFNNDITLEDWYIDTCAKLGSPIGQETEMEEVDGDTDQELTLSHLVSVYNYL